MHPNLWLQLVGWSAYLSVAATVVTMVTIALFFLRGQPWGTINDAASVVQVLCMMPLAAALPTLLPREARAWSGAAAIVGLLGMAVSGTGQGLLVLRRIDYQASTRFMPAGIGIGAWLIAVSAVALWGGAWTPGLPWVGLAAGAGYVLGVIGFLRGGQRHPLFAIGAAGMPIAYPIWAIWLGRIVLGGAM